MKDFIKSNKYPYMKSMFLIFTLAVLISLSIVFYTGIDTIRINNELYVADTPISNFNRSIDSNDQTVFEIADGGYYKTLDFSNSQISSALPIAPLTLLVYICCVHFFDFQLWCNILEQWTLVSQKVRLDR